MTGYTHNGTSLGLKGARIHPLTEAVFRNGHQFMGIVPCVIPVQSSGTHYVIIARQTNADHTAGGTSHDTDPIFRKAGGLAVSCGNNHVGFTLRAGNEDEFITLIQGQSDLTTLTGRTVFGEIGTLDDTASRHHNEILLFAEIVVHGDHSGNALTGCEIQKIYDIGTLGGTSRLGDQVRLAGIHTSQIGEHEQRCVAVHHGDLLNEVVLLGGHTDDALTAAVLCGIGIGGQTLDVAGTGQSHYAILPLDQILVYDVVLGFLNAGQAIVPVAVTDLDHFFLDDLLDSALIGQNGAQFFDVLVKLSQTCLDLLPLHTGQTAQRHRHDGGGLILGKGEAILQIDLGIAHIGGRTDNGNHLIDVVHSDLVALVNVGLAERLIQVKLHTAGDDFLLEVHVLRQHLLQIEDLRLAPYQRQHIDGAGILQLGILIQLIQNQRAVGVAAVFHHDLHTGTAGFVTDIRNTLDPLVLHLIGHGRYQHGLVHLVGDLGDDDAVLFLLDLCLGTNHYTAVAVHIGLVNAGGAVDRSGGGKIRSLDVLHQIGDGAIGILHQVDGTVNDLPQIVRGDIGGHTDSDTHRAVHQQIGETGGEHGRLVTGIIEVAVPVDHILLDIPHHFVGQAGHSRLGITVSGGTVAVDVTEVTLTFDQRIAEGEGLCHTDHSSVHGGITVGMVPTQHVTDSSGRFTESVIMSQFILVHGVEDTALTGLHTVPHVGQGTGYDNGHGVLNEGLSYLLLHIHIYNFLLRKFQRMGGVRVDLIQNVSPFGKIVLCMSDSGGEIGITAAFGGDLFGCHSCCGGKSFLLLHTALIFCKEVGRQEGISCALRGENTFYGNAGHVLNVVTLDQIGTE